MTTDAPGRVRPANGDDLPQLVDLWIELTRHHEPLDPLFRLREGARPEVSKLVRAALGNADAVTFVWESEGTLLGMCFVRADRAPPILEEAERAEITDLFVRPDARLRGIGRGLVGAAFAWLRERGIARVEVRVAGTNTEGQAFWRALGFADHMAVLQRRLR